MNYLNEYLNIMVFLSNYSKTADIIVMFSVIGVVSTIVVFTISIKILLKRININKKNSSVENSDFQ